MAVAFDAASESHTGTTGSTSQASFGWTHTTSTDPQGVLVFVFVVTGTTTAPTATVSAVTYGATSLSAVAGAAAADTATECGRVEAWFVGSGVTTANNPTITVTRTNNANTMYAVAATLTGGIDLEVVTATIALLQENGAYAEQSIDDGSPGVNSLRFAGGYSGAASPPAVGANSTDMGSIDFSSAGRGRSGRPPQGKARAS